MKFDIARQPLVPAFLTLAAPAYAAMRGAAEYGLDPALLNGAAAIHPATAVSPEAALLQFQTSHPVWARWIAGLLILFTGMCAGRMTIRYNLYSVGTCLAIPLYGAIVCGLAVGSDYLPAFTAAALLALSVKNFARSFCNGYGFDAIFRASLYLGLLPFISTAALPLLLILPPAVLLFRRTLREAVVALSGAILPLFFAGFIHWAAGGRFDGPVRQVAAAITSDSGYRFFDGNTLFSLIAWGVIFFLLICSAAGVLLDIRTLKTKPRNILFYNLYVLCIVAGIYFVPYSSPVTLTLAAPAAATLIPVVLTKFNSAAASMFYTVLILLSLVLGLI